MHVEGEDVVLIFAFSIRLNLEMESWIDSRRMKPKSIEHE